MSNKKVQDIIFTNDNCVGCNRCIASCPILGACVAVTKNGKNRVEVNSEKCISCGYCLNVCKHNAREYLDDTEEFFQDLSEKKDISVIVSTSFYILYPKKAKKVLGYLKSKGVKHFYNESFGVDISTWGYLKFIDQNPKKSFVLQPCSAFVTGIQKANPAMLKYLAPIQSPLMSLASYLRKYQGFSGGLAYLSPCISRKTEIDSEDTHDLVQYNITINHLFEKIQDVDLDAYSEITPDINDESLSASYPFLGGLKENLGRYLPKEQIILRFGDVAKNYDSKRDFSSLLKDTESLIIDTFHCENGCVQGTGVSNKDFHLKQSIDYYQEIKEKFSDSKSHEERKKELYEKFSQLNYEDFTREYTDLYQQTFEVPDSITDEIFNSMYKTTSKSRNVNCNACGYSSCKKMAKAIALGYNTIKNCAKYERDENAKLYTTDRISGLPNRVAFVDELAKRLDENQLKDYAIIQFNIKNFTIMNSRLGFEGGNAIIYDYVQFIKTHLRDDEKLFHSNGDSFFAIILKDRVTSFLYLLNNVEIEKLKINEDEEMDLRIRAGVYEIDGTEKTVNQIVERVAAAYMITRSHKNQDIAYFDKEMSDRIISTLKLSRYVVKSIENKELFVVYQPKVSIKEKKLIGAEALVRWERNGKNYPPNEFIPICETNGYVRRIDFFVLNSVCQHLKQWINRGIEPVKISVNFSKLHFEKDDVAKRILHIINKWEIPHHLIEIEFTETAYTDKEDKLRKTLDLLKKDDISSSIDDFGSGYSSLSLLQNLDFDIIKLDKSLIDTLISKEKSLKVVKNIVRMAKDLNMSVLAEGVESKNEYDVLSELDCDMIQGYLFDKPLSIQEFENRLIQKHYTV